MEEVVIEWDISVVSRVSWPIGDIDAEGRIVMQRTIRGQSKQLRIQERGQNE
jgi:hypothetical protein